MSGQEQDTSAQTIAANVASEMDRMGLNATGLAAAVGTSERQVYRVLNAEHEPRVGTIARFARVFGRDVKWLLTVHEDEVAA